MSTTSSVMSTMSVSVRGEEVILEKALDDVFQELQDNLNHMHCYVREICMGLDQDMDFKTEIEQTDNVNDNIELMSGLFKDLKSILKQISSKPQDDEEKAWLKLHIVERNLEKQMSKASIKAISK